METVGMGGLLALGWILLGAYIALLLVISVILGIKSMLESGLRSLSSWYHRVVTARSAAGLLGYPPDWGVTQQEGEKK